MKKLLLAACMSGLLLGGFSTASIAAGSFSTTGSTSTIISTAVRLGNGKVLVMTDGSTTTEIYDPASGIFSVTGNMTTPRSYFTATLLSNGKVLIAGGTSNITAELYDPVTGTFNATGNMAALQSKHTAILLPNGKVLIAGGIRYVTDPAHYQDDAFNNAAQLYDPATGTFSAAGFMTDGRLNFTSTLLPTGKVLMVGGDWSWSGSAELYDPNTGIFSATNHMTAGWGTWKHAATLLGNGKVLVTGARGSSPSDFIAMAAEIYDPETGVFTATGSMISPRQFHTATLLPNGKVLIAGGDTSSAELYDPILGTFSATGSMSSARSRAAAILLAIGKVLVVGGGAQTAELYTVDNCGF